MTSGRLFMMDRLTPVFETVIDVVRGRTSAAYFSRIRFRICPAEFLEELRVRPATREQQPGVAD